MNNHKKCYDIIKVENRIEKMQPFEFVSIKTEYPDSLDYH